MSSQTPTDAGETMAHAAGQELALRAQWSQHPGDLQAAEALARFLEHRKQWRAALVIRRDMLAHAQTPATTRQARLYLATCLVEAGQEGEAIPLLRSMLADNAQDEPALFELGTALARANDFNAALENFLRAVHLQPGDAEAQLSAAKAQVTLLRYADAERQLDAIAPGAVNQEEVAQLKGLVYAHTGRQAEAVRNLQVAAQLAPDDAEVQLELGTALSALGQTAEAIQALTRSAELHSAVGPWFQLSRIYRGLGQTENERHAVAMLQALEAERVDDNRIAALRNQAEIELRDGHVAEAAATYKQALQLRPNNGDLLLQLALLYARQGQPARERELLLRAIAAEPQSAAVLAELGKVEVIEGQNTAAKVHLQTALRRDPQNAIALTTLGVLLARENQTAPAEAMLLDAVASDPNSAEAFRDLGLVQAQRGELEAAEQALLHSLTLDPANAASSRALVQVYLAEQKATAAMGLLHTMLAVTPQDTQLWMLLTRAALSLGQESESAAAYSHLHSLAPDEPATDELRQQLCSRWNGSGTDLREVCRPRNR